MQIKMDVTEIGVRIEIRFVFLRISYTGGFI